MVVVHFAQSLLLPAIQSLQKVARTVMTFLHVLVRKDGIRRVYALLLHDWYKSSPRVYSRKRGLFPGWDIPGLGLKDRHFRLFLSEYCTFLRITVIPSSVTHPVPGRLFHSGMTRMSACHWAQKGVFWAESSDSGGPTWGFRTVLRWVQKGQKHRCFTLLG